MSLSDPSCRILVLSATLDSALAFIQRTRDLADVRQRLEPELADREETTPSELVTIPWTITNKYYSANVHFAAHTVVGLSPHLLKDVPAVVFVWTKGEPYRDDVERLAQDMLAYEPEVSLAVRMHGETTSSTSEEEENGEIDEFLSSYGFEYVCVTDDAEHRDDGVPNFPRVIDALSTIIWPTIREERGLLAAETGDVDPWTADGAPCDSPQLGFEDDFDADDDGAAWYASLASEDDLPTHAEVAATHARIFEDSDVLGRLAEMRAEIMALEDEEQRRRAAARVALGVVYGL